jgi:hypothetical protein
MSRPHFWASRCGTRRDARLLELEEFLALAPHLDAHALDFIANWAQVHHPHLRLSGPFVRHSHAQEG